eukprot:1159805-Pelagomonas_calceolata.AAC.6
MFSMCLDDNLLGLRLAYVAHGGPGVRGLEGREHAKGLGDTNLLWDVRIGARLCGAGGLKDLGLQGLGLCHALLRQVSKRGLLTQHAVPGRKHTHRQVFTSGAETMFALAWPYALLRQVSERGLPKNEGYQSSYACSKMEQINIQLRHAQGWCPLLLPSPVLCASHVMHQTPG